MIFFLSSLLFSNEAPREPKVLSPFKIAVLTVADYIFKYWKTRSIKTSNHSTLLSLHYFRRNDRYIIWYKFRFVPITEHIFSELTETY